MTVRMVWLPSQGAQSCITFSGGAETCQVMRVSLIGTLMRRVRIITPMVQSVAMVVNMNS